MNKPIRILLVDDSPYFLNAARDFLGQEEALEVVDTALDGDDALNKAQHIDLDVILLDINLPGRSGLELIPLFRERYPKIKIIVLSMLDEASYHDIALQAGADAFVHKTSMLKSLVIAIQDVVGRSNPIIAKQIKTDVESRVSFSKLIENAQDLIYRYELIPARGFTFVSPSATVFTGYTPDEHYADPDLGFKLVHPEDRHLLENLTFGGDGLHSPLVLRWIRKDGSIIWTEQRNVPVYDDNKNLVAIEGIARDITTQKRAEESLRQSEDRFRDLVENSRELICTHDLEGRILSANPAAARMLGYELEDILQMNIRDILVPGIRRQFRMYISRIERVGKASGLMHIQTAIGEQRIWEYYNTLRSDDIAAPVVRGMARDVTKRIQAEEHLRYQAHLLANISDAVVSTDVNFIIKSWNYGAEKMFGYSEQEVLGRPSHKILDYEYVGTDREAAITSLTQTGRWQGEAIVRGKNGRQIHTITTSSALKSETGKITGYLAINHDITERKLAGVIIQESQERLASVINSAMDAVISVDENQIIVLFNPAAEKMFHCAAAEAIGQSIDRFIPSRYRIAHRKHIINFGETGESQRTMNYFITIVGLRTNGEEFPIEASISYNVSAGQRLFTVILRDITERKQAEKSLRESEKQYRNIFNGVQDAIFVESLDGRILAVNDRACEMYGYTRAQFLTMTVNELVPKGELILMSGHGELSSSAVETINLRADGEHFPIEISGRIQTINGEGEGMLLVTVRDITERKRAEKALRESLAALRKAQQIAHVGSWVWHIPENRLDWSDEMFRIFGIEKDTFTGSLPELIAHAIHPDDRAEVEQANQSVIPNKKSTPLEYRVIWPDGEVRTLWAEAGELILDDVGQPVALSGIVQDITERKQAEEKLRDSKQFFHDTLDALSAHIAILDESGTIIAVNESWRLFGQENGLAFSDGGIGKNYLEFCKIPVGEDSEVAAATGNAIEAMLVNGGTEPSQLFEYPCHSPWEQRWFIVRLTKFIELGKNRVVVSHESITKRKLAEEKIRQQLARISAIKEIDQAITSTFDTRLSLRILLGQTMKLLDIDAAAAILKINPGNSTLEYAAGLGFRTTKVQTARIKLGESFAGRAALERRMVKVLDLAADLDELFDTEFLKEEGFVSYYGAPLIIKGKVIGVLEVFRRSLIEQDIEWLDFFGTLADQAAIAIENSQLFADLQHTNSELLLAYDEAIEGWSRAMDLRDKETEGHTLRVTELTLQLARASGLPEQELIHVHHGCLLHDIGKMGVPDHILLKPDELSDQEWAIMRKHPELAYEMLSSIRFLKDALDIPYCHHEKWDGTGYPRGLKGEQIPLPARLFAVVDVWDALTSDRPYRKAWSKEKALAYIHEQAGKQFDPMAVEMFKKMMNGDE